FNNDPDLEFLNEQIHNDLIGLAAMENHYFVFPSDIDRRVRELKAKYGEALDSFGSILRAKVDDGRGMEAVRNMVAACDRKFLTMYPHEEMERQRVAEAEARRPVEEEAHRVTLDGSEDMLVEQGSADNRLKSQVVSPIPPPTSDSPTPIRERGSTSLEPLVERIDRQDAKIDALV
ncbi:hypothetical protein A2U01_0048295, partial [Trifolium medium]|nr:hypothetical protein [Trifolium medium]